MLAIQREIFHLSNYFLFYERVTTTIANLSDYKHIHHPLSQK